MGLDWNSLSTSLRFGTVRRWWDVLLHAREWVTRWSQLFQRRSVGRRIVQWVLPGVLGVTLVMGLVSYLVVRRQLIKSAQRQLEGSAQNAAVLLDNFFSQRKNDLEILAESPQIKQYLTFRAVNLREPAEDLRRSLGEVFTRFAQRSPFYYDMALYSAEGRRLVSLLRRDEEAVTPSQAPEWFLRFKEGVPPEGFFQSGILRVGYKSVPIKRYAHPLLDEAGRFKGAVVMDCDLRSVKSLLDQTRIIGGRGGSFLAELNGQGLLEPAPQISNAIESFAVLREIPSWQVGVWVSEEYVFRPLSQIKGMTVAFSLTACFMVMGIVFIGVLSLMGPVQTVIDGTRRFAAGDLTYRIPPQSAQEVAALGDSFNMMAATLEQRTSELERRLRQLTALRDMEEAVIQRLDEETIMRTCLEAVTRGFGFDRAGIYGVDYQAREIVGRYLYRSEVMGFTESGFRRRRVPLDGPDILSEVVRTRQATVVRDPRPGSQLNPQFLADTRTREFILAPVCGKDRVLGILAADNYFSNRNLEEADKEGLSIFANAVGLALENTSLFQTLIESEARYRTVLDNSPEAVIGLSREHWISTWNRGAEMIFNFRAEEIIGKPLTALFAPSAGLEFKKLLNSVIELGAVRDFSISGMAKGGRQLELTVSWGGAHPDFWMNKEWTVVVRDVTDSKKLQRQLIRSEKLSAVGQLISGIAHELNNPLQAVVGYADLLTEEVRQATDRGQQTVEPHALVSDLKIITDNAMRCQKIIENLLLFVRQGEIEKKPMHLDKVIAASRDLLQYKLKKAANINVEMFVQENLPAVKGNFQQIQQVFVNLMNNACDAMAVWNGPKNLKVSVREANGALHVEVADSGPGIPESARERLFEPFFTTKAEGRGTGLGLAVCRQIIEDHSGRMGFRTEVGLGTTFWFDLPLVKETEEGPSAPSLTLPPAKDKFILLVDDEPDVLAFLHKVLIAEGSRVELAGSLKEAQRKAARGQYDVVVSDVRLDEGSGIQLWEDWSLWSSQPRPPFLFLTGDVINLTLAKDIEQRGLLLLHKPIDLASFQNSLRRLISRNTPTV